jgi:uncharacterized repeat protein (TIGR01451 family)
MVRYIIGITLLMVVWSVTLVAQGVAAGTPITNIAQLSYDMNGTSYTTQSNVVTDTVDQLISLDMVCQDSLPVDVQRGETGRALTLLLSNTGNGEDHYNLTPDTNSSASDVSNRQIWLDDGDGIFNASSDTQISDLNLSADSNATLFFVADIPANASWSTTSHGIRAESTIVPSTNPGDTASLGSYVAVNGLGGGVDSALCTYRLINLALRLDKNATLSSPQLFIGTTIHYSITASVVGTGTVDSVVISDQIPLGTSYVANSLALDGTALNNDAAYISGGTITVPVGTMTQTSTLHPTHTVTFDVVVQ